MILKDLLDVLTCDVKVSQKGNTFYSAFVTSVDLRSDKIYLSKVSPKLLQAKVLSTEYSSSEMCMKIEVEELVTNREKMLQLFPNAHFTKIYNTSLEEFSIDGGTRFTEKWLDSPYDKNYSDED